MGAEIIRDFLVSHGYGDGRGYGYGNGRGDGSGDGYGNGNGDGYGNGYGYGRGDGRGYGNGDGYGDGYGYGNGYGSGDGCDSGSGSGSGRGSGDGSGYGDGNGYGSGSGDGSDLKIGIYNNCPVHYIDTLPCVIKSIKGNIAAVDVIDAYSFLTVPMFVAKHGGFFAHGNTVKEAVYGARQKWEERSSIQERMEEFTQTFKAGVLYASKLFYGWHSILTGSCKAGKDFWVKEHGIDLAKKMTVQEFFDLTKEAYGKEVIQDLMKRY